MAKKKLYKEDGVTEDFDAEAKELDEATAGGLVNDEGEAKADALGVDAKNADAGAAAASASSDSTTGGASSEEAPAQGSSDASASSASQQPSEPEPFGELHGDVSQLADHLEGDAIDALKEAGNKLTPAVSKLHGLEDKFKHLGDEVKNRIEHAKTKLVEAMGALELIFKRGK